MTSPAPARGSGDVVLRIRALQKRYRQREGWRTRVTIALRDIDLDVQTGSILAIAGESGAGKTTLARCIAGMEAVDAGSIALAGTELTRLSGGEARRIRPRIQLIFQDPSTALNPRLTAEELISEPLVARGRGTRDARLEMVTNLMREVALSPDWRRRRPSEFSGGQLQRIAIARALAAEPRVLILDEAFTGLDLSTAAQIANLLLDLRAAHNLTYILISHDLSFAARFSDAIAVMSAGAIVEHGRVETVLEAPSDEATRALIDSAKAATGVIARAVGEGA